MLKGFAVGGRAACLLLLVLQVIGRFDLHAATPVPLKKATATFSQTLGASFLAQKAIDGQLADGLGWGILPNVANQTLVAEIDADSHIPSGAELVFTIHSLHKSIVGGNHNLGRFRLSVTADSRDSFADDLQTGGDVTANWIELEATEVSSLEGTTLSVLEDNSILASGAAPITDTYTIKAVSPAANLTGVRLEALTHASLPSGGPGRHDNGNFVVSEIQVTTSAVAGAPVVMTQRLQDQSGEAGSSITLSVVAEGAGQLSYEWYHNGVAIDGETIASYTIPSLSVSDVGAYTVIVSVGGYSVSSSATVTVSELLHPVPLQMATATFSQTIGANFAISEAIDGSAVDGLGWGILGKVQEQVAVFETQETFGLNPETFLKFSLDFAHQSTAVGSHSLGRFRISVTTDSRNVFADGLPANGDVTANWTVLIPVAATASSGKRLRIMEDGSILSEPPGALTDTYSICALTQVSGITGIRIEALEDPSLPSSGPGLHPENGNFVLSEFTVQQSRTSDVPLQIIAGLEDRTVVLGESVTLEIFAGGGMGELQFEWRHNDKIIAGADGPTLSVESFGADDLGEYEVTVRDETTALSSAAFLQIQVPLQHATASFSQSSGGDFSVTRAIDSTLDNLGWAVYPNTTNQTAVFETGVDIGYDGGTILSLNLHQLHISPLENQQHTLGRFRISATTNSRDQFADGLAIGGDVEAEWIVLTPISAVSAGGATLTILEDGSVLASGLSPNTDVYKLEVATTMTGITGLRLEALTDPSLAGWGPGRQPVYHNFVLTELDVRMRPGMPQILEHPEFLTVAEGDAAGFSVDVESRFPVTYQWFYNGDAIEDQTNATLLVDPTFRSDSGTYVVRVGNLEGFRYSDPAVLTVVPSNAGTVAAFKVSNGEPVEARVTSARGALLEGARYLAQVYAGATAEALVPVSGAVPFFKGAEAGLFVPVEVYVPEVTPGNVVQAQVRVWDSTSGPTYEAAVAAGGERGASAVLAVTTGGNGLSVPFLQGLTSFGLEVPPSFVTQPVGLKALAGGEVVFEVEAFGTGTLSYQWFFNETNVIAEATSSTLVLTNVQLADTGKYSVEVSNALGTAVSATADLVVEIAPTVTLTAPLAGETFATEVTLVGTVTDDFGIESVRWERNGTPGGAISLVDGAFSVPDVQLVRGNNVLRVIAVDSSGNEGSAEVTLTQKASRTLFIGELEPHQEGARVNVPIYLDSRGDVGGMEFALRYSRSDFVYLETVWEPASAGALTTVSTNGFGLTELNLGLALSGTAFAEGTQHVATVVFRPLTVSGPRNIGLPLYLKGLFAPTGNQIPNTGTDVKAGSVQITPRKYVGDNNANDRLDVSDASAIMRLISRLDIPRMWDTEKNDLNENQRLDAGDVIKVLRVVVGLDPQPGEEEEPEASFGSIMVSAGVSESQPGDPVDIVEVEQHSGRIMARMADAAGLALELSNEVGASGEKLVRLKVRLAAGVDRLSGASFRLDYPVEALRLEGATAHKVGALVPGDATSIWNVSPAQNDYSRQDGRVLMAVTSDNDWTQTEGVLAEFTFVVQEGAQDRYRWPITVSQAELSSGLELVTPEGASVYFTTREAAAANLQAGVAIADGAFQLSLSGEVGEQYRIEVSEDLETWSELTVILNTTGQIQLSDPIPAEGGHRFYRAAQVD